MNDVKLFIELTKTEKIQFFQSCQNLLVNHHPSSDFVIRENNINQRIQYAIDFCNKYKGFTYASDKVMVLFNKIKINDPNNPIQAIREHAYKAPASDYNAVSIDFVVFRDIKDCIEFCKNNYDPRIQFIVFVKNGKPKLYRTEQLMSKILTFQ
jgi:hypothetical protein